jgi:predicted permease
MIWLLRLAFSVVLVTMLCVTGWASAQVPLWQTPHGVLTHPWFIATLFDTYFGFLTFYVWLAYRERAPLARIAWLIAILLLGNIAMSTYMLQLLWRLPANASVAQVLLRPGLAHGA